MTTITKIINTKFRNLTGIHYSKFTFNKMRYSSLLNNSINKYRTYYNI